MITKEPKFFVTCVTLCFFTVLISNSVSADSRFGYRGKPGFSQERFKNSKKNLKEFKYSGNYRLNSRREIKYFENSEKRYNTGNERNEKHKTRTEIPSRKGQDIDRSKKQHNKTITDKRTVKQKPQHRHYSQKPAPAVNNSNGSTNRKNHNNHQSQPKLQRKHRPSQKNPAPQFADIQHNHKTNHYKYYKRNKYDYFRPPRYNTRYFAPIHYHYHPVGYRLRHLPRYHISIIVGGFPYYYFGGVFYQSIGTSYVVVGAPIGAFVETLPLGYIAFSIGLNSFYFVNDTYYTWSDAQQGYYVVEKPEGAEKAIENATSDRMYVYPKKGQSDELQAKDRYECHRWAVSETNTDPTLEDEEPDSKDKTDYRRAMSACLEGRDYSVK